MAAPTNAIPEANQHDDRFATPLDQHVFRPIVRVLAALAEPTPLGPSSAIALAAVFGVAGASLLRYPTARQIVPGALLLVGYAVVDRAGAALAEARGDEEGASSAHVIAGAIVGVACAVGAGLHVADQGGAADAIVVALGFASVLLQTSLADAVRRWSNGDDGPLTGLVARVFPEAAAKHAPELDPLHKAWGYLSATAHVVLFAGFVCADAMLAYAWLRLVAGNLVVAGLLVEQRRRMIASIPVAPVETDLPLAPTPPPPDKAAEEARRAAPISFRPPPPDV